MQELDTERQAVSAMRFYNLPDNRQPGSADCVFAADGERYQVWVCWSQMRIDCAYHVFYRDVWEFADALGEYRALIGPSYMGDNAFKRAIDYAASLAAKGRP